MRRAFNTPAWRYGVAAAITAVAAALRFALDGWLHEQFPFITFFVAVLVAAWYGGFGPGVLAVNLSVLTAAFLFLSSRGGFAIQGTEDRIGSALFVTIGLAIALMGGRMRTAWRMARESAREAQARWKEERSLRERLDTTLRSIGDAVLSTDDQGLIVSMNAQAEKLTGWTLEETLGLAVEDIFRVVDEATGELRETPVARVLRREAVGPTHPATLQARDRTQRSIEGNASPILDAEGTLRGVVLVFRDIAERRASEATIAEQIRLAEFGKDMGMVLTESASLAEMLDRCARATVRDLDGAFARVWTLDETGKVLELRASAGLYTHIDGPHARVPVGQFKIGRIAQDREPHLTNSVLGDPQIPSQDWARREGMIAFAGYPLVVDNRLVGVWAMFARHRLSRASLDMMASVAHQIALGIERKQAEERLHREREWLRVTLSSVGDAVIATDTEGKITFLNAVAATLTDWSPAEAKGQALQDVFRIVDESTRRTVENPALRALKEGVIVGLANHTVLIARDGTERAIDDSASPIRDEQGTVIGAVLIFRDVDQKRRDERAMEESEARYRTLIEVSPQTVWYGKADGSITFCNKWWLDYTGMTLDESMGDGWTLAIHPDHRDRVREAWLQATARGQAHELEIPFRRASDASFRWHLAKGSPIRDETGQVVQWVGVAIDVHDRKTATDALRESEEFSRRVIASSQDCIKVLDLEGRILSLNEGGQRLLEIVNVCNYIGESWVEFWQREDRESAIRALASATSGGIGTFEGFCPTETGKPKWWDVIVTPIQDAHGQTGRLLAVSRDITERKRAELRMGFLADAGMILAASLDYKQTLGNIAKLATNGFADFCFFDLALEDGKRVERVAWAQSPSLPELPDDVGGAFVRSEGFDGHPIYRAIATGKTEFVPDVDEPSSRGTSFEPSSFESIKRLGFTSLITAPVPVEGQTRGALTFCLAGRGRRFDPLDVKLAEDMGRRAGIALKNALLFQEAEEANRAKNQFLAVLSHELRTPLNPILLAASSMLDRPTPPEDFRPTLEMIRHNVNLQARLIDDLLDVMRIVSGKMPLHWGMADCHQVIQHAVQVCQSEVFGRVIRLTLELSAEQHFVNADAARLQQVFWNLIKNAVKFSPEGGSLTIRSRNERSDEEWIVVEVSDTGIGIEPNVLPTIFDPFQQGETSITRKFGGLGLGLAISRGIVEAHGGTITAESAGKGLGTTFRIALKALPAPTIEENGKVSGDGASSEITPSNTAVYKILVVEDEPATQRLMARLLRRLGHDITTANTIAQGIEQTEKSAFDLIISDIGLPDGSGLELMRNVVQNRGKVPSIALTGYGMEEDIVRSREAGFTAHMTKPIDFTKLEAMIRQIAGR